MADSLSTAQVIRIVPDSLPPFNVPDSLPLFNEDSISANTLQDIVSPGKRKRGHTKRTAVETAPDPGDDIDLPTLTEVDEPSLSDIQSMPCSPVIGKPDIPTKGIRKNAQLLYVLLYHCITSTTSVLLKCLKLLGGRYLTGCA